MDKQGNSHFGSKWPRMQKHQELRQMSIALHAFNRRLGNLMVVDSEAYFNLLGPVHRLCFSRSPFSGSNNI